MKQVQETCKTIGGCARQFFMGLRNQGGRTASIGYWAKRERLQRTNRSERQIDHTIEDSFPASDPPSNY